MQNGRVTVEGIMSNHTPIVVIIVIIIIRYSVNLVILLGILMILHTIVLKMLREKLNRIE